jgi:hypothetical protein
LDPPLGISGNEVLRRQLHGYTLSMFKKRMMREIDRDARWEKQYDKAAWLT